MVPLYSNYRLNTLLKGKCHEIFCFRHFSGNIFIRCPDYPSCVNVTLPHLSLVTGGKFYAGIALISVYLGKGVTTTVVETSGKFAINSRAGRVD
jgi:hypothetical protein